MVAKKKNGGARPGAGRPKGQKNKRTIAQGLSISALAQSYAPEALQVLCDIMKSSPSDAARVSAANALLDRGYGRSPQSVEMSGRLDGTVTHVLGTMTAQEAAAAYATTIKANKA